MVMIPYSCQSIDNSDIEAVVETLKSGWLTQGPAIERFEKALAKKAGAKFAVAFSSGTAALHAAYFAAGLSGGDEVIISALTFAATANAVLYVGAKPVFADCDLGRGLVDVRDVRAKINKRTKAIVPVDYGGRPADLKELRALAKKYKLVLIEDAAHSLGARYKGKPVGSWADMTMFSFHPVKSITTGEGGAIVTDNSKFFRDLILFRTHGIVKKELWRQEMRFLGYNYRMTDMQAALGESQLKKLDSFVIRRRAAAENYEKLFKDVPGIILPPIERSYEKSAWHLYPIRVDLKKREAVFSKLRAAGIGVQVHYQPVYFHPYYRKLGYKKGLCPNAERFYREEISIPIFPGLSKKEQEYIVKVLKESLA